MSILNIYFAPSKVFNVLKEKPQWIMPFIIILVVVAVTAAVTVSLTRETIVARQEEMFEERGMSEEQIEQAKQFTSGPAIVISSVLSAVIFTAILLLLFALITNLFIPLFGGESGFQKVFSVICFSALVVVPAAILKLIMIAITKSPFVTTSLALLVPNLAKTSFVYQLLAGFDFFLLWEMILVAMGITITNNVVKKNAYILIFMIWIASIFVGIGLGSIFGRGM
ncbi:MAG: YIP1 family protein [bacterium]